MSKQEKRVPELRFKGYVEEWEQRKLRDVTKKIGSGKTPKGGSSVYIQSGIPLLRSQNINNERVNLDEVVNITESMDEEMSNSRIKKNDVLLNITGASIGRSAVYEFAEPANVNQHVCIIRPNEKINPYFIQLSLTSAKGQKQIDFNQAGGAREGLNFQQVGKMSTAYPKYNEQSKIGTFFKQLDETIALHQQKLDKLKLLKKGLMQQLFPDIHKKLPLLRFANFEDDWEERKVSEFATEYFGGGTPKTSNEEYWNGDIPWIQSSDLIEHHISDVNLKKRITRKGFDNSPIKLIPKDSIAIVTRVGVGKLALMQYEYTTSQDFLSLCNLQVYKWFGAYALYLLIQKELHAVQGTSIKGITKQELLKKVILIPFDKEEQRKIGDSLQEIDILLKRYQSKIVELKVLKQTYSQKMFV